MGCGCPPATSSPCTLARRGRDWETLRRGHGAARGARVRANDGVAHAAATFNSRKSASFRWPPPVYQVFQVNQVFKIAGKETVAEAWEMITLLSLRGAERRSNLLSKRDCFALRARNDGTPPTNHESRITNHT